MADFEQFSFVIPAYTPETMPLDRLIEYLQQIGAIIGDPANMHLVKLERSSTAPTFLMPKRAALEAREQTTRLARGDGTKDQYRAYDRLRRMVRRDAPGASRPAVLKTQKGVLLEIPAAPEESGVVSGVRQATTLDGVLISLGGVGETASIRLQTLAGQVISGLTANRALAKEMAPLIYEPIRVTGPGLWGRSEDGVWGLEKMQVQSYELLEDAPLGQTLAELRDLEVAWPEDADERLRIEREGAH
jgi:hypothetical protein